MMCVTRLAAVIGWSLLMVGCSSSGTADDNAPAPVAAIRTAVVSAGNLTQQAPLYGVAEPASGDDAAVAVPLEATIARLGVTNGAHVDAGQAIANLSASPASKLDFARAGVDATTSAAALARAERLRRDGLVSDADLETARAAARAAALTQASLARRARQLTLVAPFAGSVQGLTAHEGDLVAAGTTLARVVRGDRLRARFGIDPLLARRARAGMAITITLPGNGATMAASVQSVDPVIDPATRQATLIARLPGGSRVAPGEIIKATLAIADTAGSVSIPYAALLDDGGDNYVFVIERGVAHRRTVRIGQAQGATVAIIASLKPGERVAITGGTALDDGMKVHDITGAPE